MTIKEHISQLRGNIRKYEDDTKFTDPQLYVAMNSAKNKLRGQKLSKGKKVSDFEYRTFCIELEKTKSHDCDCVPVGCTVLKSKYGIPASATSATKDMFRVLTLGDVLIPNKNEQEIKTDITDDVKGGKPGYMIRNSKVLIWNNLLYPAVQVTGLWEDLTAWEGIQYCDEGTKPCVDIQEKDFDIDGDDEFDMYMMAMKQLGIALSTFPDMTANNNPDQ